MICPKQNAAAADSDIQVYNKKSLTAYIAIMQYMLFFILHISLMRRYIMIIDRELMMRRKYTFVEGWPEVPMPLILHKIKKYHFIFTRRGKKVYYKFGFIF